MPFTTKLVVTNHSPTTWELLEDLIYEGQDETFRIPAGYLTDFASVPESMVSITNKTGPYTLATVWHDWAITNGVPARIITSRDVDGIFRRIMRELDTPFIIRWIMWAAVRLGALTNSKRAYERRFYLDAPLVALIVILSLPLAPAIGLTALTRLLLRPLKKIR